ncbi:hypothetical protein N9Y92_00295 [Chlamydiales bacterium]|nr:hypothetical protein [Chlamydiales bacterium]
MKKYESLIYSPNLPTKKEIVDPLSLFLILRELGDERVDKALEEMRKRENW